MSETTLPTEEELANEAIFNKRGNNAVAGLKLFAELILSLPEDVMPLDDKKLDELMESRTNDLYEKMKALNITADEMSTGFNQILNIFMSNSGKRIQNYLDICRQVINEHNTGFKDPLKEMPVGDLSALARKILVDKGEAEKAV